MRRGRKPVSDAVKAAADAAERRSKGVVETEPRVPVDPPRKGRKPRSRDAVAPPAAEPPPKRPVGRPTDYHPDMCEVVILAGMEGCGKAEIASRLGVVRQTVENWCEKHPEFLDAITRALEESHAWWERLARQNMLNRHFNAAGYQFQVLNRFRGEWTNKVTVAGDPDSPPIIERIEYVIVDPAQEGRA